MRIKVFGVGCAACRRMVADVQRILEKNGWTHLEVEYIQDVERIMEYHVMSTPALVIDDQVVMVGYRGPSKIEQAIRDSLQNLS
ncbi:MAG: thioredoxin family protein [Anaerolineae bacterium]|nr:MAG: thioredoxin family protein [Anaerolineae bacterium]